MSEQAKFSKGVLKGLAFQLEHPPPFTEQDLVNAEYIQIHEHTPRGIEHLSGLYAINYRGCEVVDLAVLRHCPDMHDVSAWTSNLTTLAPLPAAAPNVTDVDITLCRVRDLSPLLEFPKLRRAKLAGNPIDEVSYREIYPDLVRRGIIDAEIEGCTIEEREWELMQEFWAAGLRLSAYRVYERTQVVAPGQIVHESPEGSGIALSVRQARRVLAENPGLDERRFLELAREIRDSKEGYQE